MEEILSGRYVMLRPVLDDRGRRLWAGAEAHALGHGGISRVSEATGLSRATVRAGMRELLSADAAQGGAEAGEAPSRQRRPGGGRRRLADLDPELPGALERLLEPTTCGGPESPLRWTCSSAATPAGSCGTAATRSASAR